MVYLELTTLSKDGRVRLFSLRLFIIREQSISFNFFNHSKKLITFVLKNIVHGKSIISLIFSVNDCLVKSLALIGSIKSFI